MTFLMYRSGIYATLVEQKQTLIEINITALTPKGGINTTKNVFLSLKGLNNHSPHVEHGESDKMNKIKIFQKMYLKSPLGI